MYPNLNGELARLHHEELLQQAAAVRRARAARPAGPSLRRTLMAALGVRLVAAGTRLLEPGVAPAQSTRGSYGTTTGWE